MCTSMLHKLKRIKLNGCVNINGIGLAPLNGSIVLKEVNLSLIAVMKVGSFIHHQGY